MAAVLAGLLVAAVVIARPGGDVEPVTETPLRVEVGPEPGGEPVALDVSVRLAAGGDADPAPRPAVLLAHGFGGSKESTAEQATQLARAGYLTLTWTARGFGDSGGRIHLDDPDYEVADARRLVDLLADRDDVARDAAGDPRVGVVGGSYGGALALMLAGTDDRVDAVAASITWHDLSQALVPQHAVTTPADGGPPTPAAVDPVDDVGVFARQWAARFLAAAQGTAGAPDGVDAAAAGDSGGSGDGAPGGDVPSGPATVCGAFADDVCAAYTRLATTGVADAATLRLLRRRSPAPVLAGVRAPVLLLPGESDSLFPLSQADASARALSAAGVPVRTVWLDGGHDGGLDDADRAESETLDWLDRWLPATAATTTAGTAAAERTGAGFAWAMPRRRRDGGPAVRSAGAYPGLGVPSGDAAARAPRATLALRGPAATVVSPPGGEPAAVTGVPGVGDVVTDGLGALAGTAVSVLPGQSATFTTGELDAPVRLVGAPRVDLQVTSDAPEATLFASVYDVDAVGTAELPRRLVAPFRLTGLRPDEPRDVTVSLPALALDVPAGHRLRVVVATTDAAYAVPDAPRVDRIALAPGAALVLPTEPPGTTGTGTGGDVPAALAAVVAAVLLAAAVSAVAASRRRARTLRPARSLPSDEQTPADTGDGDDVPLVVTGLTKVWPSGLRAVDDVSFTVGRGQVVGLLGPNGAGKTTTLRMLMGLVHPSDGSMRVLGEPVGPGAPVLRRVGAFVEGPGFLPHRTGIDNLRLYWQATGRPPAEAGLEPALAVAGLGDAVHRPVRGYSHGMRQRLGIAQAMLGGPDLLVLDEPTNGLDPPQIRAMRDVLRDYAAGGRTVLVSSHLLAEVEQTCSHVVVMDRGAVVASGPVADLVAGGGRLLLDVDSPAAAVAALSGDGLVGIHAEDGARGTVVVDPGDVTPAEVVRRLVAAGVGVGRVVPQRRLEEVFLDLVRQGAP